MIRKVLLLTIFLLNTLVNLPAQARNIGNNSSVTTTVPFFTFGGMILLQAAVDGQKGYFILDTGAPSLILNNSYSTGTKAPFDNDLTSVGLNGEVKNVLSKYATLELGNQKWKNIYASLYDMKYLEDAKGITILGLIGSLVFQNFELLIDFEQSQLVISQLDKQGEKLDNSYQYKQPDVTIPFKQKGHIPYIEAQVGGLPLNLGIDSGAGIALIINQKHEMLLPFAEPGDLIRIRGLNQKTVQTNTFQLRNLSVGNLNYNSLKIAFTDLNYINDHFTGLDLDGILGLDVLSQHRMAINFKKRKIYIWVPEVENDQLVLLNAKNDQQVSNIRNQKIGN